MNLATYRKTTVVCDHQVDDDGGVDIEFSRLAEIRRKRLVSEN